MGRAAAIREALGHLRAARELLREGQAPRAVERTKAAVQSAESALRYAEAQRQLAPTPLFDGEEIPHV